MIEILTHQTSWKVTRYVLRTKLPITKSPPVNWTLSDSLTRRNGGRFLGESSLKSRLGGLTDAVIYFHHKDLLPVTDAVFLAEM